MKAIIARIALNLLLLQPGEHTVTISGSDEDGEEWTLQDCYAILGWSGEDNG